MESEIEGGKDYVERIGNDTRLWRTITKFCCFHFHRIRMKYVVVVGSITTFFYMLFLVTLYWIFTGNARYPALSETGAYIPGRYFFTSYFGVLGIGIFLLGIFLYTSQKQVISMINHRKKKTLKCCAVLNIHACNFCTWSFFAISGLGLSLLGIAPLLEPAAKDKIEEAQVQFVHLLGAFIFFASYLCHMILQTCVLFHYNHRKQGWNFCKLTVIGLFFFFWLGCPIVYYILLNIICPLGVLNDYVNQDYHFGTCPFFDYTFQWAGGLNQSLVIWTSLVWGVSLYFESSFMTLDLNFLADRSRDFIIQIETLKEERENQEGMIGMVLNNDVVLNNDDDDEKKEEDVTKGVDFQPLVDEEDEDDLPVGDDDA